MSYGKGIELANCTHNGEKPSDQTLRNCFASSIKLEAVAIFKHA